MESIEKLVINNVSQSNFDEINFLNSTKCGDEPENTDLVVKKLLNLYKESYLKNRNDLTFSITIESIQQLGASIEHLDKRLQEHTHMFRQNESSLSTTNTVLEYDLAKRKADKLVEVLKAKIIWTNTYEEIQLLELTDRAFRFQKLVKLQNSHNTLHKYFPSNSEQVQNFEKMKDEFLSWFSSATVLAIDTNDLKQIEELREKYLALNRIHVFNQIFGTYSKNKIKSFIEEDGKEHSIWEILQEVFTIWKQCFKLTEKFVGVDASKLISENLYDGVLIKSDTISKIITSLSSFSDSPLKVAKELGKVCNDFLNYVKVEGDYEIYSFCKLICKKIINIITEDYEKHVTSLLLCTINKITKPEKVIRQKHNWLLPFIDEIHSCMREIVNEAWSTFDLGFSEKIVPSFEHGIKELYSLIINQDILNIKGLNTDIKAKKSVHENTEDKISAICVTGSLLNTIDNINSYIIECSLNLKESKNVSNPVLISNRNLIERLNQKVVSKKIEAIANSISLGMSEEMRKLKLEHNLLKSNESENENIQISLPSFSILPHNYITNVGHGLLNAINTISLHSSNKNFIASIISVAGKNLNEEETDLWIFTEIGSHVMNSFCNNVGNVTQLDVQLARQYNADVVFLLEALVDLRLQPTPRFIECASQLKKVIEN